MPWERAMRALAAAEPLEAVGEVTAVVGLTITARGPRAAVGELCTLSPPGGGSGLPAEVVGFRESAVLLLPLGDPAGVAPGWEVRASGGPLPVPVGPGLVGRVLDGLGRPLDGLGPLAAAAWHRAAGRAPSPMERSLIDTPLPTGVRAIDALLTCGKGQRVGVFAGSGVGKSTLLGMIARGAHADVSVIALVGERGREVREFLARDLGPDGLQRAVVVAATSDQPALCRLKAAHVATAVAEWFRDQGMDVVLVMDSLTRLALAQREVALSVGEPPATRGYPPSVFTLLPRLLERAGTAATGSITGFYSVLVEADDMNDPVADTVRGILDGHFVLARALAEEGQFPAIDVLMSLSRLMPSLVSPQHGAAAARFRRLLAVYARTTDLIQVGAYRAGGDPLVDAAVALLPAMRRFLAQNQREQAGWAETVPQLLALMESGGARGEEVPIPAAAPTGLAASARNPGAAAAGGGGPGT